MDATLLRAPLKGAANISSKDVNAGGRAIVLYAAGISLLLLMLGLGVYNVAAYLKAGLVLLAVVALACELIGFVMAVVVEIALKDKRYWAAGVCGLILVACAAFNVIGGEHAWAADRAFTQEEARKDAQERLDTERASALEAVAQAEQALQRYDFLLPTAETVSYRQAGMRAAWQAAVGDNAETNEVEGLPAERDAARSALNALPVVAEVPPLAETYDPLTVQAGFAVAELIKVLGLWACGFGALALMNTTPQRSLTTNANAMSLDATGATLGRATRETLRATVQRLRSLEQPLSYGAIAKLTGVNKGTLWKLANSGALA